MLSFRVHQLQVGRRHYLLLPKMTPAQIQTFAESLARAGYVTRLSGSLTASSKEGKVHINSSGVCWSTLDPADAVLPAIPQIIASPKGRVPLRALESMYCRFGRFGDRLMARISTRIESYSHWDELRASDGCGLAPDEHAVARFLLRRAEAGCRMLTDFPTEKSEIRVCGRKRYYNCELDGSQAAETLRVAGSKASRNSYLGRDGVLVLGGCAKPTSEDWFEVFDELGEWCYFAPESR